VTVAATASTQTATKAAPSAPGRTLQRRCACGAHTLGGRTCEECGDKRLQRKLTNRNETSAIAPLVYEAGATAGQPLEGGTRAFMESRFGRDFSEVRVHMSDAAAHAARARAYTVGHNIVFGLNQYAPTATDGRRLLIHELVHVVQQGNGSTGTSQSSSHRDPDAAEREANRVTDLIGAGRSVTAIREPVAVVALQDDGPRDAGVLPGGIAPTPEEIEEARLRSTEPSQLQDADIGPAIELAQGSNDQRRVDAIVSEFEQRNEQGYTFGVGLPDVLPRGVTGNALVTPDIALAMVENMVRGQPPFKPELGVGGSSWFVTEGTPSTGVSSSHTIPVQAELIDTAGGLRFEQADLDRIYTTEEAAVRPEVEAQVRARFRIKTGREAPGRLSKALLDKVARQVKGLAERRMWTRVGEQVAASASKVGEVILPAGGRFSAAAGRFKVVADAARIRLRGGLSVLLDTIRTSPSVKPVPELEAAAEQLARSLRSAGKVRAVLRVGGKILIVIAIAATLLEIITAEDKLEAVIVSAVGWAGAVGGAAAFGALWTPADVAGPWAWAVHGVGMLLAGGIGFWVGSETTRYVYRLAVSSRGQVEAK
jgi:hypothetical protein